MKWDISEPCATCPYRRSSKLALWAEVEFTDLIEKDSSELGCMFACHSFRKEPEESHRPCVGWLIDQKKRRAPSILLRVQLVRNPEAMDLFNRVSESGLDLYDSIQQMYRANYPKAARRRRAFSGDDR